MVKTKITLRVSWRTKKNGFLKGSFTGWLYILRHFHGDLTSLRNFGDALRALSFLDERLMVAEKDDYMESPKKGGKGGKRSGAGRPRGGCGGGPKFGGGPGGIGGGGVAA